jgi:DNA-binding GntR family transcriptional regulator
MERPSSGELVAAHIRRLVTTGEYRHGERVRQDEIAAELGVSRIPVREALVALEREGWVTVEPHRGAYVTGLDAEFVRDHFELHGAIVGLMARRVVERADDDSFAELMAAAALAVGAPEDPAEFNRLTYDYVDTLDRVAEAPRLSSMTRVMANLYPGNFFAEVPGAMQQQRDGVAAIAAAIADRDADRAAAECERMIRLHGETLIVELDRRGVFDVPDSSEVTAAG